MNSIAISPTQRAVLLATLAKHAPPIERVDVYGSRAEGTARPGSDVDLVLEGPLDWAMVARINGALEESALSIFADVAAYALLSDGPFRDQVLATAVTLFEAPELLAARAAA